jgi:hypothetical protein
MTVTVAELAQQTLAELDKRGWCQGMPEDSAGRVCSAGAMEYAVNALGSGDVGIDVYSGLRMRIVANSDELFPGRARRMMSASIFEIHIDSDGVANGSFTADTPISSVEGFNDHEDTTLEDVRLVLKHVIANAAADAP